MLRLPPRRIFQACGDFSPYLIGHKALYDLLHKQEKMKYFQELCDALFDTIVLSPDALTYRGGHQVCTYVLLYYL